MAALSRGDLDAAALDEKERALLEFVKTVTLHAYKASDAQVGGLRALGWTDPEIAEAVYIAALFAFFNRVADAFGLVDPGYRELAEQSRRRFDPRPKAEAEPGG